jgi:hypothetical protein
MITERQHRLASVVEHDARVPTDILAIGRVRHLLSVFKVNAIGNETGGNALNWALEDHAVHRVGEVLRPQERAFREVCQLPQHGNAGLSLQAIRSAFDNSLLTATMK